MKGGRGLTVHVSGFGKGGSGVIEVDGGGGEGPSCGAGFPAP